MVGDISKPDSTERALVNSVAAMESKQPDINGKVGSTAVPNANRAREQTIVSAFGDQFVQRGCVTFFSCYCVRGT